MMRELPCFGCEYAMYIGIHVECKSPEHLDMCEEIKYWQESEQDDPWSGLEAFYDVPEF